MNDRTSSAQRVNAFAWPWARCFLCRQPSTASICAACTVLMPEWRLRPHCPLCGDSQVFGERCGRCLQQPPYYVQALCRWWYVTPLDVVVHHFKYANGWWLAAWLAEAYAPIVAELKSLLPDPQDVLVLAVPLSSARLKARGYSQSHELAKRVARLAGWMYTSDVLHHRGANQSQTGLNRKQREVNVRRAFSVVLPPQLPTNIVLVDDVMTSGATLNACAQIIAASAPSVRIFATAVARTEFV